MTKLWSDPRRVPDRRTVLAFFAFLTLALSWSLGTPLLSSADEPENVVKAAATAHGEFSGPERVRSFRSWESRFATPDYIEVTYQLPQSLVRALAAYEPQCYAFNEDVSAACTTGATKGAVRHAGTTDTTHFDYFPLYYLAVGWPSLIIGGSQAIYAMRLVSALITAFMLTAAFTVSLRRRGPATIGLIAAATPAAIYWGSVVNPSGLEITSALLAWVSFLSLVRSEPGGPGVRKDRVLFAISAALLIVVRPLGPVWLAMIVATVLATSTDLRGLIRRALRGRSTHRVGAVLLVAVVAVGLWDLTQNTMGIKPELNPDYTYAKGAYITLFQVPSNFDEMLGTVGWNDVPVPTFTTLLWYGTIVALALMAIIFGNRRERVTLLALCATVVLFPIAFEAYSGTTFGTGWQGRYTLPLAVGVPILSAEILMRRMSVTVPRRIPMTLATTLSATLGLAYLCQVWWDWRRYAEGIFGVGLGHVIPIHAEWSPAIGWPTTLVLALFGCVALFLAIQGTKTLTVVEAADGSPDIDARAATRADAQAVTST